MNLFIKKKLPENFNTVQIKKAFSPKRKWKRDRKRDGT